MTARRRADVIAVAAAVVAVVALLGVRNLIVGDPLEPLRVRAAAEEAVVRYQGFWWFPRGGPYILGFQCDGPARLEVKAPLGTVGPAAAGTGAGKAAVPGPASVVVSGEGLVTKRAVFQAGAAAVSFTAPTGAKLCRLVWHPPGRRGDPEYVPPSSLAPEPELDGAAPVFGGSPGASPVDGGIALGIAVVLAALLMWLGRDVLLRAVRDPDRRRVLLAGLAIAAVAFALRLWDLGGAGQTWDEDVNWAAGRNYVTNLLSLDFRQASWLSNYEHPPVMKYVAGIGAQLADGYGPARGLSALMIAAACGLLVAIGARLYGWRVGLLAGVIAAGMPHLVAHGKVVGHEAPTVLLWTVAIWLCLRAFDPSRDGVAVSEMPHVEARWLLVRRFAVIGVVLGLAIFSRFVNVLLAPLIGALLLVESPPAMRDRVVKLGLAVIPLAALATGLLIWPRLWSHPVLHMQEAWSRLSKTHSPEPYFGVVTATPPRSYFLAYLAATTPALVLGGVVAWIGRAVIRRRDGGERRAGVVIAVWFVAPLIVALSPVRQDGVRYVMPCLAAIAVAGAAGLEAVIAAVAKKLSIRAGMLFAGMAVVVALYLGITCARIHPYYLDYYGEIVGGPEAVARARRFEVGWWGEGLGEAIAYVNREAADGDRVYRGCVEPAHLTWFKGPLWNQEARDPATADWIVAYEPASHPCPVPDSFRMVHEVTAQGAPLVRIFRRQAAR